MSKLDVGGSTHPTYPTNDPLGATRVAEAGPAAKTAPLSNPEPIALLASDRLAIENAPLTSKEQQQAILQKVKDAQKSAQTLDLPDLYSEPASSGKQVTPSSAPESDRVSITHHSDAGLKTSALNYRGDDDLKARVGFNHGVTAEGTRTNAVEASAGMKVGQGELDAKAAHTIGANGSESKGKLSYEEEDTSLAASFSHQANKDGTRSTTVGSSLSTTLDETVGPDGKVIKTKLGLDGEYKTDDKGQGIKGKATLDKGESSTQLSFNHQANKDGTRSTTVGSSLSTTLDETVEPDGTVIKTKLGLDGEYKTDDKGQGIKGKASLGKGDTNTQLSFDHQANKDGTRSTTVGSSLSTTLGETMGTDGKTIKGNLGLDGEYKTDAAGKGLQGKVSYSLGDTSATLSASDRQNLDDTFTKTLGFTGSTALGETVDSDSKPVKGKIGLTGEHRTDSNGKELKGKVSYDIGNTSATLSASDRQNLDDTFTKAVGFTSSTPFGETVGSDGKPIKGKIGLAGEQRTDSTGKELKGKVSYDIGNTSATLSARDRKNNDDTFSKAVGFAVSTPLGETVGPDGKPIKGKIGLEGEHQTDASSQDLKGKLTYSLPTWDVSLSGNKHTSTVDPTSSSLSLGAALGFTVDGGKLTIEGSKNTAEQQTGLAIKYASVNHTVGLGVKYASKPDAPSAINATWESGQYQREGWNVSGRLELGGARAGAGEAWHGTAAGSLIAANRNGQILSAKYDAQKNGLFFSYSSSF